MASNEFYSINDIQSQLQCSYCKNRIDIPKFLPCGNTICSKCETSYIQSSDKECKSCADIHQIPLNGFPVIKLVAELLKIAPAKVYRGCVHQKTMDLVNEIGILNKNLQEHMKNISWVVSDYCDMLRTCVDIKTESEITLLNNHRDLFLSKIDSYEKQCKEKYNCESLKLEEFILKVNSNYTKWTQFLNKESISDQETSLVLNQATEQMNDLLILRSKFEKSIFGSRKLVFYENKKKTPSSILGLITDYAHQFKEMQFSYKTEQTQAYYKPSLVKINEKTVCLASVQKRSINNRSPVFNLKLTIITNGAVIKEVEERMESNHYNFYSSLILKDCLLVNFLQYNGSQAVFKIYDFNLNLIKSVKQECLFSVFFTNEKLIYGYSLFNFVWAIFDRNLNLIESIGLADGSAYPFIMNSASQVELKYGHLFSYFNRELRVVDNEKRTLLVSLKLDEKIFPNPTFVTPCSCNTFYVIDSLSKTIKSFDFEFNCLHELKLDSVFQISSVSQTHDGEIVFYDHAAATAYLYGND